MNITPTGPGALPAQQRTEPNESKEPIRELSRLSLSRDPSQDQDSFSLRDRTITPISPSSQSEESERGFSPPPVFPFPPAVQYTASNRLFSIGLQAFDPTSNGHRNLSPSPALSPELHDYDPLMNLCRLIPKSNSRAALKQANDLFDQILSMNQTLKNNQITPPREIAIEMDYRVSQAFVYRNTHKDLKAAKNILSGLINIKGRFRYSLYSLYAVVLIRLNDWAALDEHLFLRPKVVAHPEMQLDLLLESANHLSETKNPMIIIRILTGLINLRHSFNLTNEKSYKIYTKLSKCYDNIGMRFEADESRDQALMSICIRR